MTSKSRTAVDKRKSSAYLQRGMSEEISHEDVLLAQYMDKIQKAPPVRKERCDMTRLSSVIKTSI